MKRFLIIVAAGAVGCFGAHREHGEPDGGVTQCGDMVCDQAPPATCVGSTLHTFTSACSDATCSYPETDVACGAAGCCGDHCCAVTPSNVADFGAIESTGLTVAPPAGTFDTDADCVDASALGRCAPVARAGLPGACVCRADVITIGPLKVTGSRALVLLAFDRVSVTDLLDVSADWSTDGPGATYKYADAQSPFYGGAGGSFATPGGSGGAVSVATYGDPTLVPLLGGMHGQDSGSQGGGGGGALQITAGNRIEVSGVINAGGGGGASGYASYSDAGAGGGGSGGAILLEAPTVVVTGAAVSNGGGGGGGGGNGGSGGVGDNAGAKPFSGPWDPTAIAYGGSGHSGAGCPLYGYVSGGGGGAGGTGSVAGYPGTSGASDSRCIGDVSFVGGGGGGGGVGRIRINSMTGCQCGGQVLPQPTFGALQVN